MILLKFSAKVQQGKFLFTLLMNVNYFCRQRHGLADFSEASGSDAINRALL
jgi:hypothetical protein